MDRRHFRRAASTSASAREISKCARRRSRRRLSYSDGVRVRVGTSGYSYKEWKGYFYPEDLPATKMLEYYSQRFDTVEINNTFYRMPDAKMLARWTTQAPEGFTFVLKAPQRITHQKRLAG